MADLSIFNLGNGPIKQSGKMIGEQSQIAGMAQTDTICHKIDLCTLI